MNIKKLLLIIGIFLASLLSANDNIQFNKSFEIDGFLNKIDPVIAPALYNVEQETLPKLLKSYLKENKNVQAIEIIESIDKELVFKYYNDDENMVFNKSIPKEKLKLKNEIKPIYYDDEEVGTLKVYYIGNISSIEFTKEEKAWIDTHTVKIGVEQWAPVIFSNDGKDIDGICGDFTKKIIERTGLKVEIINDNWDKLLTDFKAKKIDILPATYYTDKRAKFGLYSNGYFAMKDYIYVKNTTTNINSLNDLIGKTMAIPKGYGTIDKVVQKFPKIKIVLTKDLDDSIHRLLNGKVNALYDGQIAVEKKINDELLTGLKGISQNSFKAAKLHYFSKIDEPILQSILQKGLSTITFKEKTKIIEKWIPNSNELNFTYDELKWLDKKEPIKYVYDPDWAPFEWKDELGNHKGIISDILKIIKTKTGIEFVANQTNTWADSVKLIKNKTVDMYSAVIQNSKREKYMNFTKKDIYKYPAVFVTKSNDTTVYFDVKKDLKDKIIGITKGNALGEYIQNEYPDFTYVYVDSIKDGFEKVDNNKIDVFVINGLTAVYFIKRKGYDNIKIANKFDFIFGLKIAIAKDMSKEIISILDKAIYSITDKEIDDIYYKWTESQVEDTTNWKLIGQIGGVVFLIILFVVWNNRKLNLMVRDKTSEITMLLQAFDKNIIASKTDQQGIITYVSKAFCDISGYSEEELIGQSHNIMRHPEMPKKLFKDMWKTIKSEQVWKGELKNLKKDGGFYWVEVIITPECSKNGQDCGYSAIRQDITDKKEVENLTVNLENNIKERTHELNDEKNFVNTIMNSQENFVITSDGKCLKTVNKAFLDFFNVKDTDEFMEKFGACICDTFDTTAPKEYIQKMMGEEKWLDYINNRPSELHKTIINKDEKDYIFTITSEKLEIKGEKLKTAIFTDITKMEKAQQEIEQILANILLPVLITSKKNRKILYANKYAEYQYERILEDIIGSDIDDIYTIKGQQEHIISAIEEYGFVENLEEVFKTSTGKEFTALLSVTPITYKDEDCYIGMITDISKQKEMENEVRAIHKHTRESIEYASLIQGALIPEGDIVNKFFKDSFVVWHPKDIVGGDIWLFTELRHEDECLLMFIDCTGHGVPGAFVTMIVKAIEREVIAQINADRYNDIDISPAWIMAYFNKTMKVLLKQEDKTSMSNAGWDGGIIYYNRRTQILKFAGAETPLFYVDLDGELKTIKGNRYSVGYKKCAMDYEYKETILEVKEGMKFYCTTDGYLDQNGGEKDFPFGKKRFGNIIKEYHTEAMAEQKEIFLYKMAEYEETILNNDRNDDMTVIAFEIGEVSEFVEKELEEIIKYEGIITQNFIATCMDNIEYKITNMNMMGNVSTTVIEMCQNMMNYSKSEQQGCREIKPEGFIEVQKDGNEYHIIGKNIVSKDDKEKIEPKLIEIQSLDRAGIRKRYRELRKSGQNTHEKGGGIGMYEIAKISNNIEYDFEAINEDKYYFTMKSIIEEKKKEE